MAELRSAANSPYDDDVRLVELLDRILDTGVVIVGDLQLSVAGIDLVYINLRALITSSERLIRDDILDPPRED